MDRIDSRSRATIECTLTWDSGCATHREQLWADPVNFWRDILEPELWGSDPVYMVWGVTNERRPVTA